MAKKYKSAYIIGKFMPFHLGHKYLIDTAVSKSEKVTVVVGSLPNQPIPGEYRYNWIRETYRDNPNVIVKHCFEDVPQYPEDDPQGVEHFWDIWVDIARRYCPADLDVIFDSESYGHEYARRLGIFNEVVDLDRSAVPLSGTLIRDNPTFFAHLLPEAVKPYFIKRIAFMGAESTGKSTMAKEMAYMYHTMYVEEYGRTVWEQREGKLSYLDFKHISIGRQLIEDAMRKQANKLLFCDTEDITTYLFAPMYLVNQNPGDVERATAFLEAEIDRKPKYDLYILLKPDFDGVQDGTRNFLQERQEHHERIKAELIRRNCNYVEVGGTKIERQLKINSIIGQFFYSGQDTYQPHNP